jgi:hypothetical protein
VAVVCALLCRRALPRAHLLLDARGVPGAAPSLGSASRIGEVAAQIQGEDFEERLRGIHRWMEGHLEDVPEESYQWHTFDEIVDSGRYGGCAAHSLVYGSLTRALGIPTVWVKSMDVDWIRAFRAGPEPQTWSGHVFLEVHDGERWVLLDAQGQTLYTEYDPRMRLLSGDRYAYDKGGDPFALILSTRWEDWKEQTRAYFRDFDLALLPVPEGRALGERVFIAADNPGWDQLASRFQERGWRVGRSGNSGHEQWMPEAAGQTLVVACVGECRPLPEPYGSLYPLPAQAHAESGWVEEGTASDGTRVVWVYGDGGGPGAGDRDVGAVGVRVGSPRSLPIGGGVATTRSTSGSCRRTRRFALRGSRSRRGSGLEGALYA